MVIVVVLIVLLVVLLTRKEEIKSPEAAEKTEIEELLSLDIFKGIDPEIKDACIKSDRPELCLRIATLDEGNCATFSRDATNFGECISRINGAIAGSVDDCSTAWKPGECITNLALKKDLPELCGYNKICFRKFITKYNNADFCNKIKEPTINSICLGISYKTLFNHSSLCGNTLDKNSCLNYFYAGVIPTDTNICDNLEGNDKSGCYESYLLANPEQINFEICNGVFTANECNAIISNNEDFCQSEKECLELLNYVNLAKGIIDFGMCDEILEASQCHWIAFTKNKPELCDELKDPKACKISLAGNIENPEICEDFGDECYLEVGFPEDCNIKNPGKCFFEKAMELIYKNA